MKERSVRLCDKCGFSLFRTEAGPSCEDCIKAGRPVVRAPNGKVVG